VMVHELKTWPAMFELVKTGRKTFEVRRDDRTPRFAVGDVLCLKKWDPRNDAPVQGTIDVLVTLVLRGEPIPDGYCAMQIVPVALAVKAWNRIPRA
jgi:ASC-1-like (ASCH) protein